jgi:serine/threonine protein kinase
MLFLQENSQVRTPQVYAVFSHIHNSAHNSAECYYLIMEFIEGVTLESIWASLDDEARKKICSKLSNQIRLLRSVPSEGYYGRVHYQGWGPHANLFRIRLGNTMNGPYNSYEDCISAMYNAAELRAADSDMGPDLQPDAQLYLSQFKRNLSEWECHEPKLTHLDPKFDNIMVQPIKGAGGDIKDWEVVLIDWADCGWLPAWMQAVSFHQRIGLFDENWNVDEQAKTTFIQRMSLEEPYLEQMAFFWKLKDIAYQSL